VKMADVAWGASSQDYLADKGLVAGYSGKTGSSGAVVKVALNAPGKLAYQKAFKPSGERGHRVVFDIVAR